MAVHALRLLLIEDRDQDAYLARELLNEAATSPFELIHEPRLSSGLARLCDERFDLVLLDLSLPDSQGTATLQSVLERSTSTPIVVLTGMNDESLSIQAVQMGAQDYLIKWPSDPTLLWRLLHHAIERAAIRAALRASEERYQLVLQATNDAIWDYDALGDRLWLSDHFFSLFGHDRAAFGEGIQSWKALLHPDEQEQVIAAVEAATASRQRSWSREYRLRRADGSYAYVLDRANFIYSEAGMFQREVGSIMDITERKVAGEQLRFLAEVGEVLASSLDFQTTLQQVADLAIADSADWCLVSILEADGTLDHVVFAHRNPSQLELARELALHYAFGQDRSSPLRQVLERREPLLIPEMTEEMLNRGNLDPEYIALLRALGVVQASFLFVPLVARGRGLGVITLAMTESRRRYEPQDLYLAEELARRAAVAIDNARLYQAEKWVRADAERAAARISRLQGVTVALANALTQDEVREVMLAEGVAALQADAGVLVMLTADQSQLEVMGTVGYAPEVVEPFQSFPIAAPLPLADAVRKAEAVWCESLDAFRASYPQFAGSTVVRHQALVSLPLLVDERAVGALGLSFVQPQTFSPEDRAMMQTLVQQCTQALERTRMAAAMRWHRERAEVLAQQVIGSQEEERQRLSRELHDEAGQALTALKISLELLQADLPERSPVGRESLAEAIALADSTMEQLRGLAHDLRPPALDTVGLDATLEGYCQQFARRTHLTVDYTSQEVRAVADAVAIALYRFVQEALTNIAKHARATRVRVRLERTAAELSVTVEDDGGGFQMPDGPLGRTPSQGIGLLGMQERLALLHGTLAIYSRPDQGTRLVATIPHEEEP
jgi:hypothetical protein